MPHHRDRILLPLLLLAGACTPARFAWNDQQTAEVAAYRASFAAAAGTHFHRPTSRVALIDSLRRERILWLGDHHRSPRLHELQSEFLAQIQASGIRMVLMLEAIGTQDEPTVARHLRGELSLAALRAELRARWPESWLDDTALDPGHYRGLLAFARQHSLPVLGLEPTPRLPMRERDERIATAVRTAAAAHRDRLLVVHVGQAHLLGTGDLIARTGLGGLAIGGEPPPALRAAAPAGPAPGALWLGDGRLWWFAELLATDGP